MRAAERLLVDFFAERALDHRRAGGENLARSFTITDQCERIARPAGPPAAVPSTALITGTSPSSSHRALEAMDAGKYRVAALRGGHAAARAVDQVDERNPVLMREVLDEAALAAFTPRAAPARAAAHREILAADRDLPAIDGAEPHT